MIEQIKLYLLQSEIFGTHDAIYWLAFAPVFLVGLLLEIIFRVITQKRLKRSILKSEAKLKFATEQQNKTLEYVKNEQTERFATFLEHLDKTGKNLEQAINAYNNAIGPIEHQVLPSMWRFERLA